MADVKLTLLQEVRAMMTDYVRDDVSHATAPLHAEIERLRAEVATWREYARGQYGKAEDAEAQRDMLAEALRECRREIMAQAASLRDGVTVRDTGHINADDLEECERVEAIVKRADEALARASQQTKEQP